MRSSISSTTVLTPGPERARTADEPKVLANAEPVEHVRHLRLDADAEPGDLVRLGPRNVPTAEQDDAPGGLQLAGQHLEKRALAGAVRPDQAAELALGEREVDVADGLHAAELHAEPLCFDQRRAHIAFRATAGLPRPEAHEACPRSSKVGNDAFRHQQHESDEDDAEDERRIGDKPAHEFVPLG